MYSAAPVGNPVRRTVERVVRLVLEILEDRRVVGHQIGVDWSDVTSCYELRGRVARGRDAIPLAGAHQVDHLVRGAGLFQLDLAARLLLEVGHPGVGHVSGPGDQVQLALTCPYGLERLASVVVVISAAATGDHQHRCGKPGDDRRGRPGGASSESAHFPSSSPLTATV